MKITKQEVEHVSLLARLHLSDQDKELMTSHLDAILTYMDKLNELDTKDVEPTSHVIEVENVVREDQVRDSIPVEDALANAPDKENDFFKVPRIL
ncbi:MAG: Asp-tRNA(Asn)/Glu-tRNA(Gln) amidotransferase subunit GatC [bacterium]